MQKPWCAHSSSSTTCRHWSTDFPWAYGGHLESAGTGAGRRQFVSRHGRQPLFQLDGLPVAHREYLVKGWVRSSIGALLGLVRHELGPQPDRGERPSRSQAAAPKPRVVHAHQVPQGLHCRPLTCDPLMLRTVGHLAKPLEGRRPVGLQLLMGLPQVGRVGGARISNRTGYRRSSSASTYDATSTPLTTRLLISPSLTASCITTPIRRTRVRSHSRNSASVKSCSSNLATPDIIYRRADNVPRSRSRSGRPTWRSSAGRSYDVRRLLSVIGESLPA